MMSTASLCLMAPGVSRSRGITCPSRVVTLVRTPVKFSSKSVMKWPVSWARKSYRQSAVACSRGSNEIDSRTVELNSLREELAESSAKAGAALRSCQRLREKLQKLGQAAEEAEGDVAASEPPLAQRAVVEETLKKRMERARVYLDLTEALKKAVSVRETELIALLASAGKIGPGAGGGDVGQSRDRGGTDGAKSRAADIKPWTSEREISDLFLDLERDLVRSMMTAPQPAPKSAGGAGAPGPSPTRQGQASREGSGDARKPGSVGPSQGGTPRDKLLAALEETEQLMVAVSAKLATYEGKARESLASGGGGIAGRGAEVADGSNQGEVEDLDAILARVQKARATMTDLQATRARLLEQLATTATDGAKPGTLASGSTQRPDASNGASVRTEGTDKAPGQGTGRDRGSAGGGARQGPEEGSRGGTVWEDVPSGSSKVGGASGEDAVDPMDTVARRREFIRRMEDQGESGINSPTAAAEAASLTRELLAKRLRGKEVTLGDIIGLCDRCDDLAVATVTLSDQLDAPWLYQRALKLSLAALDVETAGAWVVTARQVPVAL
eukprot:jgi/Mesvir1/22562/Mv18569-RA.2